MASSDVRLLRRPVDDGTVPLAVRVAGSPQSAGPETGRPVVLVHGMAGDHSTWRPLASRLRADGRAVVSVDLRGHGRSGRTGRPYLLDDLRDDLAFVLDDLELTDIDLVGHSLGAHTALRLTMHQPDRVHRLVLEEVPPMPRDQADVDEGIAIDATFGERVRGILDFARNPMPVLRFDRRMAEGVGAEFEIAAPEWWSALAAVISPTLVISGGPRSFLPPRHLRSLAEALPDARFVEIDAGHSVHRDAGREFGRTVADFLLS